MKVGSIFILIGAALIVPLVIISDVGRDAEAVKVGAVGRYPRRDAHAR